MAKNNEYIRNRGRQDTPENQVTHRGKIIDPQEGKIQSVSKKQKKKTQTNAPKFEPIENQKVQDTVRLRQLADAIEMDLPEFEPLAKLSVDSGKKLVTRLQNIKEIVLPPEVEIDLDPTNKKLLKNLIGKEKLDRDGVKCLTKLANHNALTDAVKNAPDTLDGTRQVLENAFNDDRVKENFPDFGPILVLLILYIVPKHMHIIIFHKLCDITTKVFSIGPRIIGINLGKLFLVPLFQKIWNTTANCLIELNYWLVGYVITIQLQVLLGKNSPAVKMFDRLVNGDKGACIRAARGNFTVNVCGPVVLDVQAEAIAITSTIVPGSLPFDEDNNNRCNPDYKPSDAEVAIARHVLQGAMEQQAQGAASTTIVTKQKISKLKTYDHNYLEQYTILDRLEGETQAFIHSSDGLTKKLYSPNGNRIVDKVDANMLGFFTVMNGTLQRIDKKATDALALKFMPTVARKWLCCIVRLLYLLIPRITLAKTGRATGLPAMETLSLDAKTYPTKNDFPIPGETGKVYFAADSKKRYRWTEADNGSYEILPRGIDFDDAALIEDAKIWARIIDSLLGIMTGSTSASVSVKGLQSLSEIFQNAFMMALSEGLSVLTTALYRKLKKAMFDNIEKFKDKYPDFAQAIEMCPPFANILKALECGLENLFAKLMDMLAKMWAEAAKSMQDFDIIIAKSASTSYVNIFRKMLQMIINWDQALINFCQLNKVASEAEKDKMIEKLVASVESDEAMVSYTLNPKTLPGVLDKVNEIYSRDIHIGPEDANFNESSSRVNEATTDLNPIYDESKSALLAIFKEYDELGIVTPAQAEEIAGEMIKALPANSKWDPKQVVMSCGDEFKHLLENRYEEIWDALTNDAEPDFETTAIIPPEIEEDRDVSAVNLP